MSTAGRSGRVLVVSLIAVLAWASHAIALDQWIPAGTSAAPIAGNPDITLEGTLLLNTADGPTGAVTSVTVNSLTAAIDVQGAAGKVTLGGPLIFRSGNVAFTGNAACRLGIPNTWLNLAQSAYLSANGPGVDIGSLWGASHLGGTATGCTIQNLATLSGNLLEKFGTGSWTITGDNSGEVWGTDLQAGRLALAPGAKVTNTRQISIQSTATLGVPVGTQLWAPLSLSGTLDLGDGVVGRTDFGNIQGNDYFNMRLDISADGVDHMVVGSTSGTSGGKVAFNQVGPTLTPGAYTFITCTQANPVLLEQHFGFDYFGPVGSYHYHYNIIYTARFGAYDLTMRPVYVQAWPAMIVQVTPTSGNPGKIPPLALPRPGDEGTPIYTSVNTPVGIVLNGIDYNTAVAGSVQFNPATIVAWAYAQPAHGTVTGTAPNVTYTPAAGFSGTDSFTFTVTDNNGSTSAPATIYIGVGGSVNLPPMANSQLGLTTSANTAKPITLSSIDYGINSWGTIVSYAYAQPAHGTVTGTAPNVTYTPASSYTGNDRFTFTVTDDGGATSTPAVVAITVGPGGSTTTTTTTTSTTTTTLASGNLVVAGGGATSTNGGFVFHTFTASGAFTVSSGGNVEVLVVAGGGGAARGGGGAGGVRYRSAYAVTNGIYAITVGPGGPGSGACVGDNGGISSFGTITADGGGGGGSVPIHYVCEGSWAGAGQPGGSGGGAGNDQSIQDVGGAGNYPGGYNPVEGYAGGSNTNDIAPWTPTGGGGGAGHVGYDATASGAGNGGAGAEYPQFASVGGSPAGWFGGGGGGGCFHSGGIPGGTGGMGGGGNGSNSGDGQNGAPGTGGGGGGRCASISQVPGDGGSGIVIVRYASSAASVSRMSASRAEVVGDGASYSTIIVTLLDANGSPLVGRTATLAQGGGHSAISASNGPSDGNGVVTFTVSDSTVETVTYTATDQTDGFTLAQTAAVTFVSPVAATGGTETTTNGYRIHTFTSSGTLNVTAPGAVEVLVVGGGGAGCRGGGGAGGVRHVAATNVTVGGITIAVGAGGPIGADPGNNGSSSSFGTLTADGGGGGGNSGNGRPGGSGGGAGNDGSYVGGAGNSPGGYSPVEGYKGGDYPNIGGAYPAGGGGGAGAAGGPATVSGAGNGGAGVQYLQFAGVGGSPAGWFGGGGGGGVSHVSAAPAGTGGMGGGGDGSNTGAGQNAQPGTGGGGGGRCTLATLAEGGGGSGIVIVRYPIGTGAAPSTTTTTTIAPVTTTTIVATTTSTTTILATTTTTLLSTTTTTVAATTTTTTLAAGWVVNFDYDVHGGSGASNPGTYVGGAAGPGSGTFWNAINGGQSLSAGTFDAGATRYQSDGATPTPVQLSVVSRYGWAGPDQPAVPDNTLLCDFATVGTTPNALTLTGVLDGTYEVYIYAINGGYNTAGTIVTVAGGTADGPDRTVNHQSLTFVKGDNYVHFVNVVVSGGGGTIACTYVANTDRPGNTEGDFCGLQLVRVLPGANVPPPVISISSRSVQGGMVELSWPSVSNATYGVYRTTNLLAGWPALPLTNGISGDGATLFFREPDVTLPAAFYRLKALSN